MTEKKLGLGKGLNALLGEESQETPLNKSTVGEGVSFLALEDIIPSPYQPRQEFTQENIDELVASIKEKGVLQPILVRESREVPNKYEIIAGERRFRASKEAGLQEIPIIIKHFSDEEVLQVALIENLQRQNLSPLEEAEGYRRLMEEFDRTQLELSEVLGKSRSHIANMTRLLGLPDKIKSYINEGKITTGHARALLNADHPEELAEEIVSKELNVRETEELAKKDKSNPQTKTPKKKEKKPNESIEKNPDIVNLEKHFSEIFSADVSINIVDTKGNINIKFDTLGQLDDIIQLLANLG